MGHYDNCPFSSEVDGPVSGQILFWRVPLLPRPWGSGGGESDKGGGGPGV